MPEAQAAYTVCLLAGDSGLASNAGMLPVARSGILSLLLMAVCAPASADIYAYTDAEGVTHFSNVPTDSRYQLMLSSPRDPAGAGGAKATNWLARSAAYDELIESAAQRHTVHAALIRAVIVVESGFNPRAKSPRGAVGLMQLLPQTARRYGVSDIYDPAENIGAGAHYLADLMSRFDSNLSLVLAAYNAGENAVDQFGGRVPPFRETQAYVPKVLKIYHSLRARSRAAARLRPEREYSDSLPRTG